MGLHNRIPRGTRVDQRGLEGGSIVCARGGTELALWACFYGTLEQIFLCHPVSQQHIGQTDIKTHPDSRGREDIRQPDTPVPAEQLGGSGSPETPSRGVTSDDPDE